MRGGSRRRGLPRGEVLREPAGGTTSRLDTASGPLPLWLTASLVASYVFKRLLWAVALFFAITLVSFVLFFVIPSEPGRVGVGRSSEAIDLRNSLGVQGPMYEEYGTFVWKVLHGSFGESWTLRRDVNEMVLEAIPVTVSLVLGGAVIWMLIAIPVGITQLRPSGRALSWTDRRQSSSSSASPLTPSGSGSSSPYYFGSKLEGSSCRQLLRPRHPGPAVQRSRGLGLPPRPAWLTFALLYAAICMRMIRAGACSGKERGLRADRSGERRQRGGHPPLAHPAQRIAAHRDDAGDGPRRVARERDLRRAGLPPRTPEPGRCSRRACAGTISPWCWRSSSSSR